MIPDNRLSSELVYADWVLDKPDSDFKPTEGFELGGEEINANLNNLQSHVWKYYYKDNSIYLNREDRDSPFLLDTIPGLTHLSVTFTQSLSPVYSFTDFNGHSSLKWFDSLDQTYKITDLGSGVRSPMVTLDIKEKLSTASDVLLVYVRNNTELVARYQRDRFSTEYLLGKITPQKIVRIGMNKMNRIQFLMEEII